MAIRVIEASYPDVHAVATASKLAVLWAFGGSEPKAAAEALKTLMIKQMDGIERRTKGPSGSFKATWSLRAAKALVAGDCSTVGRPEKQRMYGSAVATAARAAADEAASGAQAVVDARAIREHLASIYSQRLDEPSATTRRHPPRHVSLMQLLAVIGSEPDSGFRNDSWLPQLRYCQQREGGNTRKEHDNEQQH